jgi:lactoylglutathione lyase
MITGIGHTAFDCYHFEQTLDFYTRVLGFPQMFELHNDAGELWIVYLRVTDRVYIELFPKQGEAPAERDRHFSHLCLEVDDIEATVQEIASRGATIDVQIQRGKDGNLQAWTRDPEGNRIELMQLAPDSLQMQAIARLKQADS